MASKQSAGIVLYRRIGSKVEFFLVHPGGPLWAKKDEGAWSIPKGEFSEGEDPCEVAKREFYEETGQTFQGDMIALQHVKLKSGKTVWAWAVEGNIDPAAITSNTFTMEWPPKSGRLSEFPEVDKGGWFNEEDAKYKINPNQRPLIDELLSLLEKEQ